LFKIISKKKVANVFEYELIKLEQLIESHIEYIKRVHKNANNCDLNPKDTQKIKEKNEQITVLEEQARLLLKVYNQIMT
jgi:hypothetical protein